MDVERRDYFPLLSLLLIPFQFASVYTPLKSYSHHLWSVTLLLALYYFIFEKIHSAFRESLSCHRSRRASALFFFDKRCFARCNLRSSLLSYRNFAFFLLLLPAGAFFFVGMGFAWCPVDDHDDCLFACTPSSSTSSSSLSSCRNACFDGSISSTVTVVYLSSSIYSAWWSTAGGSSTKSSHRPSSPSALPSTESPVVSLSSPSSVSFLSCSWCSFRTRWNSVCRWFRIYMKHWDQSGFEEEKNKKKKNRKVEGLLCCVPVFLFPGPFSLRFLEHDVHGQPSACESL